MKFINSDENMERELKKRLQEVSFSEFDLAEHRKAAVKAHVLNAISKAPEKIRAESSARFSFWQIRFVIPALAAILFIGGTVFASGNAKPGDPLYPLAKAVGNVRVSLTFDTAQKAKVQLQIAQKLVDDYQQIQAQNASNKDLALSQTKVELNSSLLALAHSQNELQIKGDSQGAAAVSQTIKDVQTDLSVNGKVVYFVPGSSSESEAKTGTNDVNNSNPIITPAPGIVSPSSNDTVGATNWGASGISSSPITIKPVINPPPIVLSSPKVITMADNGKTIVLKIGQQFILKLGNGPWFISVNNNNVLQNIGTAEAGIQGKFQVIAKGAATISAADSKSILGSPANDQLQFSLTIQAGQ